MGLHGWRLFRVVVALVGAVFGFVVLLLSLLPGAPYLPDGMEFIPFVMAFPLFGWAVIERAQTRAKSQATAKDQLRQKWYERGMTSNEEANRSWTELGVQIHRYRVILAIGIPVIILMWILGLFSIVSLHGQPVHSGNQYYLDDHGSHIPVTKSEYEHAVAQQERIFAAGGTGFLIVAAGLTLSFDPKSGTDPETEPAGSA
jgi:hypothetical protein